MFRGHPTGRERNSAHEAYESLSKKKKKKKKKRNGKERSMDSEHKKGIVPGKKREETHRSHAH